jgi:hypothetical protein
VIVGKPRLSDIATVPDEPPPLATLLGQALGTTRRGSRWFGSSEGAKCTPSLPTPGLQSRGWLLVIARTRSALGRRLSHGGVGLCELRIDRRPFPGEDLSVDRSGPEVIGKMARRTSLVVATKDVPSTVCGHAPPDGPGPWRQAPPGRGSGADRGPLTNRLFRQWTSEVA